MPRIQMDFLQKILLNCLIDAAVQNLQNIHRPMLEITALENSFWAFKETSIKREPHSCLCHRGGSKRGRLGRSPPKIFKSNFIHHDFVQFGKQHVKTNTEYLSSCSNCLIVRDYGDSVVHRFVTAVLWSIFHLSYCCEALKRLDC